MDAKLAFATFSVQLDDHQPGDGGFSTPISGFSSVPGLYKNAENFPLEETGMEQCPHVCGFPIHRQSIDYPIGVPEELSPM